MSDPNPLRLVSAWLQDAARLDLAVPHAAVLSTMGLDGYPNARNVAIKEVTPEGIVVTGSRTSHKGHELASSPQCALTLWWDALGRQIRVQGDAHELAPERASRHFAERSREARMISSVSEPGKPRRPGALEAAYQELVTADQAPPMPESWGGWMITPLRIELLEFSEARFHSRVLFARVGPELWEQTELQP